MKLKITVILTMLLLFALTGCNNTPQTEKMPEPFSFSESKEQTSQTDMFPAAEETNEVETTPESMQSTEPAETESIPLFLKNSASVLAAFNRSSASSSQGRENSTSLESCALLPFSKFSTAFHKTERSANFFGAYSGKRISEYIT